MMLSKALEEWVRLSRVANMDDAGTRCNVRTILMPALEAERRSLVEVVWEQRKSCRPLPESVRRELLADARRCREAFLIAKRRLREVKD